MKVLHVIPSVSPLRGGPSKAIIDMVRALEQQHVTVEIATTNDHGMTELDVALNQLIEYKAVKVRFFKRFSPKLSAVREFAYSGPFKSWLKKHIHDYDLIHVHALFSFTSSYAMRLARKRKIPYIVRPIGQLETWAMQQSKWRKRIFLSLFEYKNLLHARGIHFTADSEQEQALQQFPALQQRDSSFVLPLGIDTHNKQPEARDELLRAFNLAPQTKIVLYLSRLHPKKGLELLLEALSKQHSTPWYLLIAGEGDSDYTKELRAATERLNIKHQCQFLGFKRGKEKQQLLQGSDLYALTSYSENFGISVLEALAAGTPAVISNQVALSRMVRQHNIGYVCDTSIESIRIALNAAFNDETDRGKVAAQVIHDHYSWKPIAETLKEQYQHCLGSTT